MADSKAKQGPPIGSTAPALNLYQKLAKITGEIGAIAKDGQNNEQNFKFIEYAAVAGKLRALFDKYGVVVVPRMPKKVDQFREVVTARSGKEGQYVLLDMTFQVVNADDPTDTFDVPWTGEAIDYGDKATNKAATSALKYYLMRQFNISEKGEDADEASHDVKTEQQSEPLITDEQRQALYKALTAKGVPVEKHHQFLKWRFQIDDVDQLTLTYATKAIDVISKMQPVIKKEPLTEAQEAALLEEGEEIRQRIERDADPNDEAA